MAKNINYPKKETMNLAMKEKSPFNPFKLVPAIILIIMVAGLFGKFAVYDLFAQLTALQLESNDLANQITVYTEGVADYDEVLDEYTKRSNNWMTEEELAQVDYKTFFPMVETCVLPYSDIKSVSINGNQLSFNLVNLSLQDASNIIRVMSVRDDVVTISINTANRDSKALTNEKTGEAVLLVELTNGYVPKPKEATEDMPVDETANIMP